MTAINKQGDSDVYEVTWDEKIPVKVKAGKSVMEFTESQLRSFKRMLDITFR